MNRKAAIAGALVTCLGAFLSMVAINAQGGTGLDSGEISSDRPVASSVDASQAGAFGVLRTSQQSGDALDPGGGAPFGANGELARAVRTPEGTVRVVPGNGWLCLRAEDSVGSVWTCGPNEQVEVTGLLLTLRDPEGDSPSTVYGLVPDQIDGAVLRSAGAEDQLEISQNVFAGRVKAPDSVTLSSPQGKVTVNVP
jgi:hypothetical protein